MLIPQNTSATSKAIEIQKYHIGSSISVVGTITNPIIIEQPLTEFPTDESLQAAFIADDGNWQQRTSGETSWQLDATNLTLVVDGALGWTRFKKPAGDNVGVNHKW